MDLIILPIRIIVLYLKKVIMVCFSTILNSVQTIQIHSIIFQKHLINFACHSKFLLVKPQFAQWCECLHRSWGKMSSLISVDSLEPKRSMYLLSINISYNLWMDLLSLLGIRRFCLMHFRCSGCHIFLLFWTVIINSSFDLFFK